MTVSEAFSPNGQPRANARLTGLTSKDRVYYRYHNIRAWPVLTDDIRLPFWLGEKRKL